MWFFFIMISISMSFAQPERFVVVSKLSGSGSIPVAPCEAQDKGALDCFDPKKCTSELSSKNCAMMFCHLRSLRQKCTGAETERYDYLAGVGCRKTQVSNSKTIESILLAEGQIVKVDTGVRLPAKRLIDGVVSKSVHESTISSPEKMAQQTVEFPSDGDVEPVPQDVEKLFSCYVTSNEALSENFFKNPLSAKPVYLSGGSTYVQTKASLPKIKRCIETIEKGSNSSDKTILLDVLKLASQKIEEPKVFAFCRAWYAKEAVTTKFLAEAQSTWGIDKETAIKIAREKILLAPASEHVANTSSNSGNDRFVKFQER